jgi:hypothetical protein
MEYHANKKKEEEETNKITKIIGRDPTQLRK